MSAPPEMPGTASSGGDSASPQAPCTKGRDCLLRAEFDGAVIHLSEALQSESDRSDLLALRAEAFRALGRLSEALTDLDKAISISSGDLALRLQKGRVLSLLNRHGESIDDYNAVIAACPDSLTALLGRAASFVELRQLEAAAFDYSRATLIASSDFQAYFGRGKVHALSGAWDRAIVDFTRVIELNSAYIPAYIERAHAHRELGEFRQAISDYTEVLSHVRNPSVFVFRGQVYERIGEPLHAIADYSAAIELNPDSAIAYARRGMLRRLEGDFEAALMDLDQAIAIDPMCVDAFFNRGMIGLAVEQFPQAIEQFNQAIARSPQHIDAYLNRALAYERLENYRRSIRDCTRVLKWQPQNAMAFLIRGSVWLSARNFERAVSDLSEALALEPTSLLSKIRRSRALTHLRRFDEALADCDAAVLQDPANALAFAQRSIVHRLLRRPEQAMTDLERAMNLEPRVLLTILDRGLAEHDRQVNSTSLSALGERPLQGPRKALTHQKPQSPLQVPSLALDPPIRSQNLEASVSSEAEIHLSASKVEITHSFDSERSTSQDPDGNGDTVLAPEVVEESAANVFLSDSPEVAIKSQELTTVDSTVNAPAFAMAPVKHRCPMCGVITVVPSEKANERVQCSACHVVFMPTTARPSEPSESAPRLLSEPKRGSSGPRLVSAPKPARDQARWIAAAIVAGTVAALGGVVAFAVSGPSITHVATHPVRGQVVYDGKPLANAIVTFSPVSVSYADTPPPRGTSQSDGSFTLGTYGDADGAPAGEYKVVVSWKWEADELGTNPKIPLNPHQARLGNTKALELSVRVEPGQNTLPAIDVSKEVRKISSPRPTRAKGRTS